MDYVKLARTTIDQFLDKLEEEANKLLEEDRKPKHKQDDFGWYAVFVRLQEIDDERYGTFYRLLTDTDQVLDKSLNKQELLDRWGLEED